MWLRTARPEAHPLIFAPLCFGQSLALTGGCRWSWTLFAWAIAIGVLVHALIAFGRAAADGPRRDRPPHRASIAITFGSLLALGAAGAVLAFRFDRAFMLALVMLPSMLLWLDSFPPLALRRRGLDHWLHAAGVGAVLPLLGAYLQCGELISAEPAALAASCLAGISAGLAIARDATPRTRSASCSAGLLAFALTPLAIPDAPAAIASSVAGAAIVVALIAFRRREQGESFARLQSAAVIIAQLGWALGAWFSRLPLA